MMERITRISFGLLRLASLGLVVVYLIAVITVGAAGHYSGDSLSFSLIFAYAVILVILLSRFQKRANRLVRTLLLVILIPAVGLFLYYVFMIVYQGLAKKSGLMGAEIFIGLILIIFVASSIVVIRALVTWNPDSTVGQKEI